MFPGRTAIHNDADIGYDVVFLVKLYKKDHGVDLHEKMLKLLYCFCIHSH